MMEQGKRNKNSPNPYGLGRLWRYWLILFILLFGIKGVGRGVSAIDPPKTFNDSILLAFVN